MKRQNRMVHSEEARLGIFLIVIASIFLIAHITRPQIPPAPQAFEFHVASPIPESTPEIVRGDTSKKQVIFTFDGGDTSMSGEAILAALAKHHVKGTFFLTGKFVEAYPELAKKMVAQGEVFDHTFDHPHLTELTDDEIAHELSRMSATLDLTTGMPSGPYFRAPYGDRDARVNTVAARAGYRSVYWTVDARDWMASQGETNDSVEARIMENLAPGNIYLMHVGDHITGDILDKVLTGIEARGYVAVSLMEGI